MAKKEIKERHLGVRVPHSLYHKLAAYAEKRNVPLSVVIREALETRAVGLPNPKRRLV